MAQTRYHAMQYDPALLKHFRPQAEPATAAGHAPTRDELLAILRCMDLTTLNGDDTQETVAELCGKAVNAVDGEHVAAVCVYPVFIRKSRSELGDSPVKVATVAAGFPHGLTMLENRVTEVESARDAGADEIDIVIQRAKALCGEWPDLYREILLFREACGGVVLKVILATGELTSPEMVYHASMTAMMAGADFIKTSTGKEKENATPEVAAVMLRAIADFRSATGRKVGFKAAGGIRSAEQAVRYVRLCREIVGEEAVAPNTFRIGASSLLDDVVRALG